MEKTQVAKVTFDVTLSLPYQDADESPFTGELEDICERIAQTLFIYAQGFMSLYDRDGDASILYNVDRIYNIGKEGA